MLRAYLCPVLSILLATNGLFCCCAPTWGCDDCARSGPIDRAGKCGCCTSRCQSDCGSPAKNPPTKSPGSKHCTCDRAHYSAMIDTESVRFGSPVPIAKVSSICPHIADALIIVSSATTQKFGPAGSFVTSDDLLYRFHILRC